MSNPFTSVAVTGYNADPPSDDGSKTSANQLTWAKHKTKIGDPLKTALEAMNANVLTAFGKVFGTTFLEKSADYTITVSDQGKFVSVTGTSTITLPAAASAGTGFALVIVNTGTGLVTVDGNASETINGSTSITLAPDESMLLTCNSSSWAAMVTRVFGNHINAVSGDYTVTVADRGGVVIAGGSLGTVALLAAATAGAEFLVTIINNTGAAISIDGNSSETINGSTSLSLPDGAGMIVFCTGSEWFALSAAEPSASTTVSGKVELATGTETIAGTDATRAVTPDGLGDMLFAFRYDAETFTVLESSASASGWTVADAGELGKADIVHGLGLSSIHKLVIHATPSREAASSSLGSSHLNTEIQEETVNGFSVQVTQVDNNRAEVGAVNIIAYRVP